MTVQRSEILTWQIHHTIQQAGGSISFADYMEQVLYTPKLGYYMANTSIFGATEKTGDFTTAPEISSLFGQTLAQACHTILKKFPNTIILELGAGTGKLATDILLALEKLGTPPSEYWILDISPMLREKQKQSLMSQLPHWEEKIHWLDKLPEQPFSGIIIANEVLDALPAQRFQITANESFEAHVKCEQNLFQEEYKPTDDPEIQRRATYIREIFLDHVSKAKRDALLNKHPYQSERLPVLKSFFQHLFSSLKQGVAFFIDYGFPQHEYYHPDRNMGTLMCHYKQQAHSNPYINIGLQDITTHIDFTDVAEKGTEVGFKLAGYTQQAAFLMNAGLLTLIENQPILETKKALSLLTSPSEMGELFKVMAFTKNLTLDPFPGFEHFDKRHTL